MKTETNTTRKYLINCRDGKNNVERATISFIMGVAASATSETAMFVTADAAHLCVKDGTKDLVAKGYEPLTNLMDAYIENEGKIWLCPACAAAKGITQNDLREGVELAGAVRTMDFMVSGAQLLA